MQDQKTYYKDKIVAAKKRIDDLTKLRATQESRMGEAYTNEFISRNPIQLRQIQQQTVDLITDTDKNIKEENQKIQSSIEDVRKVDEQVNELKLGTAVKKDVQTFKFVADALGVSLDTVARWFILSIIFVFDPLAISLILAYNVAVYKKEDESVYDNTPSTPIKTTVEPIPVTPEPISQESPTVEKVLEKDNVPVSEWFRQMFKL